MGSTKSAETDNNKKRQLTVQFLHAEFAAGSEVSGKSLCRVLKIDVLFRFVRTRCQIAVYRPVPFSAEYKKVIAEKLDATQGSLLGLCVQDYQSWGAAQLQFVPH